MSIQESVLGQERVTAIAPWFRRANRPPLRKSAVSQQIGQWLFLILCATATYLFLCRFVLQTVQVQGKSMVPTLHDSDRYFLNRWVYHMHPPQRGDVVVLRDPSDGVFAVKRIVAFSGDALFLKDGQVYLNGRRLSEPYLYPHTPTYTSSKVTEELILCGRDQYFVMGDNRTDSFDSRMYGPVPRRDILGALVH